MAMKIVEHKLPDMGAVAPGLGQRRLRSWPGPTEIHVAKKYHPRSEISGSFPSPSSSIKLFTPSGVALLKANFIGYFHRQCQ